MSIIWADRVLETSSSTGTGAVTLAGAVLGYRTLASVCTVGDLVHYMIEAVNAGGVPTGEWEVGIGTYSAADTLTRTTILSSSNSGAAVAFSAGTKRVALTHSAAAVGKPWYFNPPKAARFTLSNGGGASNLTLQDDPTTGLVISPVAFASGSLSAAFALENVPGAFDWTVTAHIQGFSNNSFEYNGFGLCLYENATSRFIQFNPRRTLGPYTSVDYWNNASTFNTNAAVAALRDVDWLRVKYNHGAGTYAWEVSSAGKVWFPFFTASKTALFAVGADKVGFSMGASTNAGMIYQFSCDHYEVT